MEKTYGIGHKEGQKKNQTTNLVDTLSKVYTPDPLLLISDLT